MYLLGSCYLRLALVVQVTAIQISPTQLRYCTFSIFVRAQTGFGTLETYIYTALLFETVCGGGSSRLPQLWCD